jgi:hypothetical protein
MKAVISCVCPLRELLPGAVDSGFFVGHCKTRGHHPPLVTVLTTNTDKRGELALSSLIEHISGEC